MREGVPGHAPDGQIYTVTDVAGDTVVLDGNHPLAGIAVEFRCVVREVRRGTAFIEGRMGVIEVDQGDIVPGLGRVEAIRKQDGRWVVVTSRGLILSPAR